MQSTINPKSDIALIGLGVMGKNLTLNLLTNFHRVSVYNRTTTKTTDFINEHPQHVHDNKLVGCTSIEDLVRSLKKPHIIILVVQAGQPVDTILQELSMYVCADDVIIDMGNSYYKDTTRRCVEYKHLFRYIGCGISGGEEGARYGPSLMPGGDKRGWETVKDVLQGVSAKYGRYSEILPCCEWIGEDGSGHFVKMVHNGIEYGDMAIISEAYSIMKNMLMTNSEISSEFRKLNEINELRGYLTEITVTILGRKENGVDVIDMIEDRAENKGTGLWSITAAMDCQYHCTLIAESVFSRMISYEKDKRMKFCKVKNEAGKVDVSLDDLKRAMVLAKCISYIQGMSLIKRMSDLNGWNLDLMSICRLWRNGCIIRGVFLETLEHIVKEDDYENSAVFVELYNMNVDGLRRVVVECVRKGLAVLCMTSCLTYLDAIGTERGSGNVIQALRDYFGAHKVKFVGEDEDRHVEWDSK